MKAVLDEVGAEPTRVQVMSLDPDDVVPLELAYELPYPTEAAALCAGLLHGSRCGAACSTSSDVVCALGFWGTRHVIERRFYDETVASTLMNRGAEYAMAASPNSQVSSLRPLANVVFASSDRAASFDATAFTSEIGGDSEAVSRGAHGHDHRHGLEGLGSSNCSGGPSSFCSSLTPRNAPETLRWESGGRTFGRRARCLCATWAR